MVVFSTQNNFEPIRIGTGLLDSGGQLLSSTEVSISFVTKSGFDINVILLRLGHRCHKM